VEAFEKSFQSHLTPGALEACCPPTV